MKRYGWISWGFEPSSTLLDILLRGHELPRALARGWQDFLKMGFSPPLKINARTKVHQKGNLHPRAKARVN